MTRLASRIIWEALAAQKVATFPPADLPQGVDLAEINDVPLHAFANRPADGFP
jgi:hypothetical protein